MRTRHVLLVLTRSVVVIAPSRLAVQPLGDRLLQLLPPGDAMRRTPATLGPRLPRSRRRQRGGASTPTRSPTPPRSPPSGCAAACRTGPSWSRSPPRSRSRSWRTSSGGDRDSIGLFQQRPSQGWGKPEQIADPRYAADAFYTALLKVKGWEKMRVTDAAQAVQRSAHPNAYEKWADESEILARALTGGPTGAVACTVTGEPVLRGAAAAAALLKGLRLDWGTGLARTAEQPSGLTVEAADAAAGWRYAHWLVSHARSTGLERVRFAEREWQAGTGAWRAVTGGDPAGARVVVAQVFR